MYKLEEASIPHIPVVPFGLDERSNPKGHIHSFMLNQPNELHQIIVAFEVELHNIRRTQKEIKFIVTFISLVCSIN
jgi:hypothetical protein